MPWLTRAHYGSAIVKFYITTMDDLLQKKKIESCRLNLPDGLQELMSDISREVLRAQPSDLYRFIADYLSALLVTRDNLSVAGQVFNNVCQCECHPELLSELQQIGLDEGNARIVEKVVLKYFKKEEVKERNLLAALMARTNIKAHMYPAVANAVRLAYIRHQADNTPKYEASVEYDEDEIATAVSHTLEVYRQSEPTDGLYGEMATKIQAAYRAYGVRRKTAPKTVQEIRLETTLTDPGTEDTVPTSSNSSFSELMKQEIDLTTSLHQRRVTTESSITLAGSFCTLPRHKPYNAHDAEYLSLAEETEKEHAHIDYTAKSPHLSLVSKDGKRFSNSYKRISFQHTSEEELYKGVTAYEDSSSNLTAIEETSYQEQESDQNKKQLLKVYDVYNNECSESSDETIPEEVIELESLDYGETDIDYINVMNMEIDTDSGEDLEAQ